MNKQPPRRFALAIIVLVMAATGLWGQGEPPLKDIVRRLGSPDFSEREAAQRQLDALPPSAFDAIDGLIATTSDDETKVRLTARLNAMALDRARLRGDSPLRIAAHITGRVIDAAGKPVSDARVMARSTSWGSDLWWTLAPETRSGADGRFDLGVPFKEIFYQVEVMLGTGDVRSASPRSAPRVLLIDKDADLGDLPLLPVRGGQAVAGTLLNEQGLPVANQPVDIIGEYGNRATATTNANGEFTASEFTGYLGQAVPFAHIGGRVLPVKIIRPGGPTRLTLVPPGTLSGRVTTAAGKPLAGATVFAAPWFASGLLLRAISGPDGLYHFRDMPPGEYVVTAEAPGFALRPPRGDSTSMPRYAVTSAAAATADLQLEAMATLYGAVHDEAGRPVPDAVVGIISTWRGDYRDQWRAVPCDDKGNYLITTGHTAGVDRHTDAHLVAFSAAHGMVSVSVADLGMGEARRVILDLPGSVRIAGTLVDPAGSPAEAVEVIPNTTASIGTTPDNQGRFDLGRVSLVAKNKTPDLLLRGLRPKTPFVVAGVRGGPDITGRDTAPQFYAHQRIILPPGTQPVDLRLTMQHVPLIEFTGTVLGASGQPTGGADVYILTGDANPATWLDSIRPSTRRGGGILLDWPLAAGKTDAKGRYSLWVVQEPPNSPGLIGDHDFTTFSIGAYSNGKSKLSPKVDPQGKQTVAHDLKLDE
jgi:protocatechuate 3,4-dioxygenase beta subunit